MTTMSGLFTVAMVRVVAAWAPPIESKAAAEMIASLFFMSDISFIPLVVDERSGGLDHFRADPDVALRDTRWFQEA
ncbi:hypothetical protein [Leptothrix cholodnii]|uniref:hypothetical protein n=1 Tax=Leptothrix cholodnii TaxID=34029 RepID=UPI001CB79C33|nr:hypothetical protein [Leptothrix cholodnii]